MMEAISERCIESLTQLPRKEGQVELLNILGWHHDAGNLRDVIRIDCIYDCVMFCINRGFTWSEVCHIFHLVVDMLDATEWRALHGAITQYKSSCHDLQWKIDVNRLNLFNTFFFTTFMSHYRLYQLVMSSNPCDARHVSTAHLHLPVSSPPRTFPSLDLGIDPDVWHYQKTIDQLEKVASETRERREAERILVDKEDDLKMKTSRTSCEDRLSACILDQKKVLEIIQQVADAHISAASHAIQHTIREAVDDLELMLDKTTLPRPHALGPPPRFNTKSVIVAPNSKQSLRAPSGAKIAAKKTDKKSNVK